MCFCLPTAVEVDTIDHTPYGRKVVRKTTYGLHSASDSSSFGSNEKPRRRFGTKTDYYDYDDAYYASGPIPGQRAITYDMPTPGMGMSPRQPLLLEAPPPPPMPVLRQSTPAYNIVDAHPTGYGPSPTGYASSVHTVPAAPASPIIYDAEPEPYGEAYVVPARPRAGLPRGISTRRRSSGVRYGRGNPHDSDRSLEYDHYRDSRDYGIGSTRGSIKGVRFG